MDRKQLSILFRRYVNDQATEEEINELMRMVKSGRYDSWIKSMIDRGLDDEFLYKYEMGMDMSEQKASELLQNLLKSDSKKIAKKATKYPTDRRYLRSPSITSWKWVAAAVVLLTGFLSLLYMDMKWITGEGGMATVREVAMQEIITERGERVSLILGDGSRVTVNANSRVRIPLDYGQETRTLILDGEAFFEVEHNPEQPFRVYTGEHIYTEVLGTKFNVRNYEVQTDDEGGSVDVVVAEGRVRLGSLDENQPNSVVVRAGQRGEIGEYGIVGVSRVSDFDKYLGWVNGRLKFDDHPFGKVVSELERWYDIEIEVTEPALLDRRLTASFEGDPLSEVLQVVGQSLQIDVSRENRTVQFSSQIQQ